MKKIAFPILTLALLPACSASGPIYTERSMTHGQAQLIIYQPSSTKLTPEKVDVNGQEACSLPSASYCVVEVPPGPATVSASIWDMPGTSRLTVQAKAGQRYYVRVRYSIGAGLSFAAFGVPGAALEGGGPYLIEQMPDGGEVAGLHESG